MPDLTMLVDFEFFEPFDIDNGELDGLTPQQIFVLGYELAEVKALLESNKPFSKAIHAENKNRVEKRCKSHGKKYQMIWHSYDTSEGWLRLTVE